MTSSRHSLGLPQSENVAVAREISKLLAHYPQPNVGANILASLAEDWLEDLSEFSSACVAAACRQWRRTSKYRPTIAEIRALCEGRLLTEQEEIINAEREKANALRRVDYDSWVRLYGFSQ
jgi:hypothetical protein